MASQLLAHSMGTFGGAARSFLITPVAIGVGAASIAGVVRIDTRGRTELRTEIRPTRRREAKMMVVWPGGDGGDARLHW